MIAPNEPTEDEQIAREAARHMLLVRHAVQPVAHRVECVIPRVPVRLWALSFPIPLHSLFAVHPELLAPVLQIIHRVINTFLIKQADVKRKAASTSAITFIQRFGFAANLNNHLGVRRLGAAFESGTREHLQRSSKLPRSMQRLQALLEKIINKINKLLTYQHNDPEQLCRSVTRPAIANERLGMTRAGQVVLKLKTPISYSRYSRAARSGASSSDPAASRS